jgi:4,5-DOPA dioxygenase extradiol
VFAVEYPAPGGPALAEQVAKIAKPTIVGLDTDVWGPDHRPWSVLIHVFPEADVPVVQLSINAQKPFADHLELGAKLAPLRDRGVLVMGSGNVVHHLRRLDWAQPEAGFEWARRFDDAVRDLMGTTPGDVVRLRDHTDFRCGGPDTRPLHSPALHPCG